MLNLLILKYRNMKKIILKKARYNRLPETIFVIVVFAAFLGLALFDILSGVRKVSDSTLIGGFVFFCRLFNLLFMAIIC